MKKIIIVLFGWCLLTGISYACGIVRSEIRLTGVIDGDTFKAEISGMPEELKKVSVRITGIDTPEIRGKCGVEKAKAKAAKEFLIKKFNNAQSITFGTMDWDKYGRKNSC